MVKTLLSSWGERWYVQRVTATNGVLMATFCTASGDFTSNTVRENISKRLRKSKQLRTAYAPVIEQLESRLLLSTSDGLDGLDFGNLASEASADVPAFATTASTQTISTTPASESNGIVDVVLGKHVAAKALKRHGVRR